MTSHELGDPFTVSWYFEKGPRHQMRFGSARLMNAFAEAMKERQKPLVIARGYEPERSTTWV